MRGFFEIGIYRGKCAANVGTLWRSAYQLGASGIFTVGRRYPRQSGDTVHADRHVPCREFVDADAFMAAMPFGAALVAVEMGGRPLKSFVHPQRAVYLLGSEDRGIPPELLARARQVVSLPAVRTQSYNVAVAGSIVMFDRLNKEAA